MPDTREAVLLTIGNLVSDSVDPGSSATKIALLQCEGADDEIIKCIADDDAQVQAFAVGALQNLCGRGAGAKAGAGGPESGSDREWSKLMVQYGVHQRLEQLLSNEDPMVKRYASMAQSV